METTAKNATSTAAILNDSLLHLIAATYHENLLSHHMDDSLQISLAGLCAWWWGLWIPFTRGSSYAVLGVFLAYLHPQQTIKRIENDNYRWLLWLGGRLSYDLE